MKLFVIKIGGNVIDNPETLHAFLDTFAQLPFHKILIHGGGKIATQVAEKLQITTTMVEGRRITDQPMLDVATMVYGGLVNKNIVALLQQRGSNAIGLTGADAGVIRAKKRPIKEIDYGFVGDIEEVSGLQLFLDNGLVPIIAPLSFDAEHGTMLNTNADTMASAVAVALSNDFDVSLVYCFEKKGVLSNPNDEASVIAAIDPGSYTKLKAAGVVNKGMIPKLDNAFEALQKGVSVVNICEASQLKAVAMNSGVGTSLSL